MPPTTLMTHDVSEGLKFRHLVKNSDIISEIAPDSNKPCLFVPYSYSLATFKAWRSLNSLALILQPPLLCGVTLTPYLFPFPCTKSLERFVAASIALPRKCWPNLRPLGVFLNCSTMSHFGGVHHKAIFVTLSFCSLAYFPPSYYLHSGLSWHFELTSRILNTHSMLIQDLTNIWQTSLFGNLPSICRSLWRHYKLAICRMVYFRC